MQKFESGKKQEDELGNRNKTVLFGAISNAIHNNGDIVSAVRELQEELVADTESDPETKRMILTLIERVLEDVHNTAVVSELDRVCADYIDSAWGRR